MLLAALVLLILVPLLVVGVLLTDSYHTVRERAILAVSVIIGLGLGVAAVRPPRGNLRRILVGVGAVVILLTLTVMSFILLFIIFAKFVWS